MKYRVNENYSISVNPSTLGLHTGKHRCIKANRLLGGEKQTTFQKEEETIKTKTLNIKE